MTHLVLWVHANWVPIMLLPLGLVILSRGVSGRPMVPRRQRVYEEQACGRRHQSDVGCMSCARTEPKALTRRREIDPSYLHDARRDHLIARRYEEAATKAAAAKPPMPTLDDLAANDPSLRLWLDAVTVHDPDEETRDHA